MKKFYVLLITTCLISQNLWATLPELKGEPYLSHCIKRMDFNQGRAEESFLRGVKTPGQMFQFLVDYNWVLTPKFYGALLNILPEYGVAVGKVSQAQGQEVKPSKVELKEFAVSLAKVNQLPAEDFSKLIWSIVDGMAAHTTTTQDPHIGQIMDLQTKNLADALQNSSQRELFEEVMGGILHEIFSLSISQVDKIVSESRIEITSKAIFGVSVGLTAIATSIAAVTLNFRDKPLLIIAAAGAAIGAGIGLYHLAANRKTHLLKATDSKLFKQRPLIALGSRASRGDSWKDSTVNEYALYDRALRIYEVQSANFYRESVSNAALSLEEVCRNKICSFTPLQLAYLGHLDLLKLQAGGILFQKLMNFDPVQELDKGELGAAALAVRENPTSYKLQASLNASLVDTMKKLLEMLKIEKNETSAFLNNVKNLKSQIQKLREKPYTDYLRQPEDIAKAQFLLAKINIDLSTIDQIIVDDQAIEEKVQATKDLLETFQNLSEQLPKNQNGSWRDVAEKILLLLDGLK